MIIQLQGGKKAPYGKLTGGYGTIKLKKGIFGIKSKLCLKLFHNEIHSISGEFKNNTLEVCKSC